MEVVWVWSNVRVLAQPVPAQDDADLSGKRTGDGANLAARTQVYEITLTRGYDESSFRDDLKQLYGAWGSCLVQPASCSNSRQLHNTDC